MSGNSSSNQSEFASKTIRTSSNTRFIVLITRYIVLIPILGLTLAAMMLFIFGGFHLIGLVVETTLSYLGMVKQNTTGLPIYVEIIEYVHTFLIGTVLYLTAVGFFQLFIGKKIELPGWMQIQDTMELETDLIGVAVVVLVINFMSISFRENVQDLARYGIAIALPIAALGFFLGMRAWAKKQERHPEDRQGKNEAPRPSPEKVVEEGS